MNKSLSLLFYTDQFCLHSYYQESSHRRIINIRFSYKIWYLCIDNEKFLSKWFVNLMINLETTIECSAFYTSVQNDIVEYSGKMIFIITRIMRIVCNFSADLWSEIVKIIIYILNRISIRKLNWKTLFESLTKKKSNLIYLHLYDYRVYVLKYDLLRKKKLDIKIDMNIQ